MRGTTTGRSQPRRSGTAGMRRRARGRPRADAQPRDTVAGGLARDLVVVVLGER